MGEWIFLMEVLKCLRVSHKVDSKGCQVVNQAKSFINFLGNISTRLARRRSAQSGLKQIDRKSNYLGLPMFLLKPKKGVFEEVMSKVCARP
jgi:hypothetical protein